MAEEGPAVTGADIGETIALEDRSFLLDYPSEPKAKVHLELDTISLTVWIANPDGQRKRNGRTVMRSWSRAEPETGKRGGQVALSALRSLKPLRCPL